MSLRDAIIKRIRTDGPMPFTEYMDLALYDPTLGYYSRADRRSGRAGDFFTSVDTGSLFGELLSKQFGQMWRIVTSQAGDDRGHCDLVEAGAGDARLARDILDRSTVADPEFYAAVRYTPVERSPAGRRAHTSTLDPHRSKLRASGVELPSRIHGIIFANELLDALPVHPIVMTGDGLREVYVDADGQRLVERLGPVSSAARAHVERFRIRLEPGWRAEVCPAAISWVEDAGRCLDRGFLILVDYGHDAAELYSLTHATGTLASYRRHYVATDTTGSEPSPPWLEEPGTRDITTHVDLTAVRQAAERAGLRTLGILDQTYFVLGLASAELPETESDEEDDDREAMKRRLALKTLLLPGGLGSTHKVLIFGKNVGTPQLLGCSFSVRATR
jgi:SAM-dependent MidA family methyltransferase